MSEFLPYETSFAANLIFGSDTGSIPMKKAAGIILHCNIIDAIFIIRMTANSSIHST